MRLLTNTEKSKKWKDADIVVIRDYDAGRARLCNKNTEYAKKYQSKTTEE